MLGTRSWRSGLIDCCSGPFVALVVAVAICPHSATCDETAEERERTLRRAHFDLQRTLRERARGSRIAVLEGTAQRTYAAISQPPTGQRIGVGALLTDEQKKALRELPDLVATESFSRISDGYASRFERRGQKPDGPSRLEDFGRVETMNAQELHSLFERPLTLPHLGYMDRVASRESGFVGDVIVAYLPLVVATTTPGHPGSPLPRLLELELVGFDSGDENLIAYMETTIFGEEHYVFDRSREGHLVRWVSLNEDGKRRSSIEIDYQAVPETTRWALKSWERVQYGANEKAIGKTVGTIDHYEFINEVPPETFTIAFPNGTLVRDNRNMRIGERGRLKSHLYQIFENGEIRVLTEGENAHLSYNALVELFFGDKNGSQPAAEDDAEPGEL